MRFEGIYTPLVTAHTDDHGIDHAQTAAVIDYLIDAGVHGIIVAGTTGEYYAQTVQERLEMMAFVHERIGGRGAAQGGTRAH
ncbi:MAG: dihydrodipicolinate synthase family protein, partial [Pseudomonadota bacterium]